MTFHEVISTVDNVTGIIMAGMMIIQVIFIGATFWFGSRYLEQHKQKAKVERELELIYDSMKLLHKLRRIWVHLCEVDKEIYHAALLDSETAYPMIERIGLDFREKYSREKNDLNEIRSMLRVNVKLIDEPDSPKIDNSFIHLIVSEEVLKSYYLNLKNDFKFTEYRRRIQRIPSGFYDKEKNSLFNQGIEKLLDQLADKYNKKNED